MLRSTSWCLCEDVGGQPAREAGQHRLGLGAELGQLLCVFGGQAFHEASANTAKSSASRGLSITRLRLRPTSLVKIDDGHGGVTGC